MGSPPPRHRSPERGRRGDRPRGALTGGTRGQSVALEYTLSLAVASLVITGLFLAGGDFVTSQRERVVRTELGVVGEQVAGEVAAADRLVQAGETSQLSVNASLPSTIAGSRYTVAVDDTGTDRWVNVSTDDPEVTVSVRLRTETPLEPGAVDGGRLTVVYDPTGPNLEIRG